MGLYYVGSETVKVKGCHSRQYITVFNIACVFIFELLPEIIQNSSDFFFKYVRGIFFLDKITLISAWIIKCIYNKVWD